jgi:hypothetical protein
MIMCDELHKAEEKAVVVYLKIQSLRSLGGTVKNSGRMCGVVTTCQPRRNGLFLSLFDLFVRGLLSIGLSNAYDSNS